MNWSATGFPAASLPTGTIIFGSGTCLFMWEGTTLSRELKFPKGCLAISYAKVGRVEECQRMQRDVYSVHMKLHGEEHKQTLRAIPNYAHSLCKLQRYAEVKTLLRKTIPVAQRVIGVSHEITLRMRGIYAEALYRDDAATLDDLREAVTTLEEVERTARRVLGGANPHTKAIEDTLVKSRERLRASLRARETPADA